ncbi:MAG: small multi-drug export protein [Thermoplasmata archaeon]|nr:MAG: small multi-drug export protein [Thermoplasmata archaeon]
MGLAESIIDILQGLPSWLIIIFIAMIPFIELRGTILLWAAQGGDFSFAGFPYPEGWIPIYIVSVIGNMIPIPFILLFFPWVEKKLRRWKIFDRFFDWLFARTRKRTGKSVEKYEELALVLFVAIPLPITGAWTGSLVSYLFGLDRAKSIIFIFIGVLIAGAIMLALVLISLWIALAIIIGLTIALILLGRIETRE